MMESCNTSFQVHFQSSRRLCQSLQHRAGDNSARPGSRRQLTDSVWTTFVAGNARRAVSTLDRRALAYSARTQPTHARQLRRALAAQFGGRTVSRSDHTFPSHHDHRAGRESTFLRAVKRLHFQPCCTTELSGAGIEPAMESPTESHTCESRIERCRLVQLSSMRSLMLRSLRV